MSHSDLSEQFLSPLFLNEVGLFVFCKEVQICLVCHGENKFLFFFMNSALKALSNIPTDLSFFYDVMTTGLRPSCTCSVFHKNQCWPK